MQESGHRWRFFRAGGFDQVRLDDAADLLALENLDQKLWMALSCPVTGLQFDQQTLDLIDTDRDGHIRAPELISAVNWARTRLEDPSILDQPALPLCAAHLRIDSEEGQALAHRLGELLEGLGKAPDASLSIDEIATARVLVSERAQLDWRAQCPLPAEVAGAELWQAYTAVKDKVEDFFLRCRLGSYDERALPLFNATEDTYKSAAAQPLLPLDALRALPLAKVTPACLLPLEPQALNPAWHTVMQQFRARVLVTLGHSNTDLTVQQWQELQERLMTYEQWQATRPGGDDPVSLDLERLARYVRDLLPLANDFVAFRNFYTRQGKATFQAGTLYLDGRSCDLCITVNDPTRHAQLATLARICLVYCDCTRAGAKMTIAAALTAGDSDQLMVGRNGVFYDRQDRDWDATIVKIIEHPISLRQAFWSPYKRMVKLMGEQVQKFAASKASENDTRLARTTEKTTHTLGSSLTAGVAPASASTPAIQAFDVAKFAGIFAAIGMAVGALGTAIASVTVGLLSLKWWQMPLALGAGVLAISGPAVILAWFKLRTRSLGPLLDANGWAINGRAAINLPFGTALTQLAQLPPNAERSLKDPYANSQPGVGFYLRVGVGVALVLALLWWLR